MSTDNFRDNPPYGLTESGEQPTPTHTRSDFSIALTDALNEEIEAFGEEINWRGVTTKGMPGTSKETKAMMAAGYYENQATNLVILPPESIGITDTSQPKVNEIITMRNAQWRIEEVDHLELGHGYGLTIQKLP